MVIKSSVYRAEDKMMLLSGKTSRLCGFKSALCGYKQDVFSLRTHELCSQEFFKGTGNLIEDQNI